MGEVHGRRRLPEEDDIQAPPPKKMKFEATLQNSSLPPPGTIYTTDEAGFEAKEVKKDDMKVVIDMACQAHLNAKLPTPENLQALGVVKALS